MITHSQAVDIAAQHIRKHRLGAGVGTVLLPDEITGRKPMLYGVSLENCWIAYVEPNDPLGLRASTCVVIDRSDGAILYHGSANDEG